jgi:hypothetical protein
MGEIVDAIGKSYRDGGPDSEKLSTQSKKMRVRDPGQALSLEPHVCRHCFGRLLSSPHGGARRYVCANCGATEVGASADVLCCCGVRLKGRGPVGALLTCSPNPNPTAEFPSQIVAIAGDSAGFNDSKSAR